jgi:hypothetical protein
MFEETEAAVDKDSRSRFIMFGSAIAVLLVIAGAVVVGSRSAKPEAGEVGMAERATPEFDAYAQYITVDMSDKDDKWTYQNLLGNYTARLRARITNTGDRVLIGLRLRAIAVGYDEEVLSEPDNPSRRIEKYVTPVPRVQETLAPYDTFHAEVLLDRIPPPDQIRDMRIELVAFKLK